MENPFFSSLIGDLIQKHEMFLKGSPLLTTHLLINCVNR